MSSHYSSFHRGPEDHDPPPAYTPVDPAVGRPPAQNPSAPPGGDTWQNQSNERREAHRHSGHQVAGHSNTSHVTPSGQHGRQFNFNQQTPQAPATSFQGAPNSSQPHQPPAGPFYPSTSPPAGPFYGSTGATSTHPPHPTQSVQSQPPNMTTGSRSSPANQRPSQGASNQSRARPAMQRYNSDTEGVSAYGGTSGMNATRVDSDLNIRAGDGGGCCAIL